MIFDTTWKKARRICNDLFQAQDMIVVYKSIHSHGHTMNTYFKYCITVTSEWARWRLKSPASRLFTQSLFRRRSKKIPKPRVTGLCEGNSPVTGEFPAQQRASNAENIFHLMTSSWSKSVDVLNISCIAYQCYQPASLVTKKSWVCSSSVTLYGRNSRRKWPANSSWAWITT